MQCRDKVQTVVVDNPIEECDMEPIRTCKWVYCNIMLVGIVAHQLFLRKKTKLVPRLVASQECVDVPKEICARSKINPRRVRKPAIQRWCYKTAQGDKQVSPQQFVKI